LTFKHTEKKPGNYTVEVGGETTTYIVKEKSSLLLYALGAIILLFVGGAAYYFYERRWRCGRTAGKDKGSSSTSKLRKIKTPGK